MLTHGRKASVALAVVMMAFAGACGGASEQASPRPDASPSVSTSAPPASLSPGLAGCTEVQTVEPYEPASLDANHEPGSPLSSYRTTPPASGPHDPTTLPAGLYPEPPDVYQAIHSMEHGAAVIWYRPGVLSAEDEQALRELVAPDNGDHTIVAPYDYPDQGEAGQLPEGTDLALAAWHRLQTCDAFDLDAVGAFLGAYKSPPLGGGEYLGEAPEAGIPI